MTTMFEEATTGGRLTASAWWPLAVGEVAGGIPFARGAAGVRHTAACPHRRRSSVPGRTVRRCGAGVVGTGGTAPSPADAAPARV